MSLFYIVLAALGLSFLVFIHELGHYIVALRNGMKVEVFSIGFGKPIVKWKMQNVEWRICWLLFGGFVKIVGMEREGEKEPHDIEGGFYNSTPWARIKVAVMGPLVNIVFAFLVFSAIWMLGGRDQSFAEHTKLIGWVDEQSELYDKGIRPGDEISSIDGRPFRGFKDLMYSAVLAEDEVTISGRDIDYYNQHSTPFSYAISSYPDPKLGDKGLKTFGVVVPARYMIYKEFEKDGDNPIPQGSPMSDSGIMPGDRIVWVNGNLIYGMQQMSYILNRPSVLLTVERNGEKLVARVPKLSIGDLRLNQSQIEEFDDWAHELGMKGNLNEMNFIPYDVSASGVVKSDYRFINDVSEETSLASYPKHKVGTLLHKGDRILAVDGKDVTSGFQILAGLQQQVAHIVVQRNQSYIPKSWKTEDQRFISSINYDHLRELTTSIGQQSQVGDLVLLKPVMPLTQSEFTYSQEHKEYYQEMVAKERAKVEAIKDPKRRAEAQRLMEIFQKQRFLGIALQDLSVVYNPNPFVMFEDIIGDTYRTLSSLLTGQLNPKWLSGPVGFVQVMHRGWMIGVKEALYWLGLISLGLAIFNLLPIPALDGGHICFSLYEWITGKRIKAKVMERLVLPFVVLLIGLFIFVTFQDVMRLFY